MSAPTAILPDAETPDLEPEQAEETRMSFGDHLEELRRCLVRGLFGVGAGVAFAFFFGDRVIEVVLFPLLMVQAANGLQPQLQALSPTSAFMVYMKIAMLAGIIVSMPWLIRQVWGFVATGLYVHERRFVKRLIAPSVGLFALGVVFLYFIVLPVALQFFISFNRAFGQPNVRPLGFQSWLVSAPAPPLVSELVPDKNEPRGRFPVLAQDPADAASGECWINAATGRLVCRTPAGLRSVAMDPSATGSVIQSQFALDQYVSFVLMMALAFGIAFETPVVVYFLASMGIVSLETMTRGRRYVILLIAIAAAVLTPTPDIINQLLLAVPLYGLFELGVWLARLRERRHSAQVDSGSRV